MAKPNETTMPDTPTTERALPPGGATAPAARTEVRAVPGPGAPAPRDVAPVSTATRVPSRTGTNGRPTDPAEMRREIERTRARMSGTLDALESRVATERAALERKKDELVDRATLKGFREKLSREPWRSMAIAFVAGYVVAAIRD